MPSSSSKAGGMPGIVLRKIDSLTLYALNARTHDPAQIEQLAASIEEFGWTFPILADDEGIVAGHGRLAAAGNLYALGKTLRFAAGGLIPPGMVPVLDCSGWTPAQRRTYILADNKIALNAGWNLDLLRGEFEALELMGVDLDTTGFSLEEREAIMEPIVIETQADPDAVPPVPEVPHSQPGDVWVLGPHRIICGDSTQLATWDALMGTELADCVLTDPPYGVDRAAKNKSLEKGDGWKRSGGDIKNDGLTGEQLQAFLTEVNVNLHMRLKPGASLYVFHPDSEALAFRNSLLEAAFKINQGLVWVKDHFALGQSRYQSRHEALLYATKPGSKTRWFGGRKQTTVMDLGPSSPFVQQPDGRWVLKVGDEIFVVDGQATVEAAPGSLLHHPKPARSPQHPSMKPVALLQRILTNACRANDLVLEPFSGSGSTLMAAERLGMCARAVEIDPAYLDVSVMRWQNYTGRAAVNLATGKAFPVAPDPAKAF